MNIYIFKRADGSEWSDYRLPTDAEVLRTIPCFNEGEILAAMQTLEDRPRALAERLLREKIAEPPPPALAEPSRQVRELGFWRRLKWMLTGKV